MCANSGYQAVFFFMFERPGYEATDTQTDTQTKYCNTRCVCAPRVKNIGGPPPIPLPHFAHAPQPQIAGFNSQYVAAIYDTRLPNTTFFRTYHKENIP